MVFDRYIKLSISCNISAILQYKLLIYKNNNIINLTFKIIESIQIEKTTISYF